MSEWRRLADNEPIESGDDLLVGVTWIQIQGGTVAGK